MSSYPLAGSARREAILAAILDPRHCIRPPREEGRDTDVEPLSGYRFALEEMRELDDGAYYELPEET